MGKHKLVESADDYKDEKRFQNKLTNFMWKFMTENSNGGTDAPSDAIGEGSPYG